MVSRNYSHKYFFVKSLVVDKIAGNLPNVRVDDNFFPELKIIPLAQENFARPGEINGILGFEICFDLIGGKHIMGVDGFPVAIKSIFGYVVISRLPIAARTEKNCQSLATLGDEITLESHLRKF